MIHDNTLTPVDYNNIVTSINRTKTLIDQRHAADKDVHLNYCSSVSIGHG
jgi:hypothetical protein